MSLAFNLIAPGAGAAAGGFMGTFTSLLGLGGPSKSFGGGSSSAQSSNASLSQSRYGGARSSNADVVKALNNLSIRQETSSYRQVVALEGANRTRISF
jgi:hypothetical protein